MGRPIIDLTGQKFGDLTVLGLAPKPWRHTSAEWLVRCRCGEEWAIQSTRLRNVGTRACRSCSVSGDRNGNWTGATVIYNTMHFRVRKALGSAQQHSCVDCGSQAQHWTYKKKIGHSPWLTDYEPRCISCHRRFDKEV